MSNIKKRKISELKPHPKNPRKISNASLRALKNSLRNDPEMLNASPVVCTPEGLIIFGHQRVKAAKELGWTEINVLEVKASDEEITKWMLKDNVHAGEFDEGILKELLRESFEEMEDVIAQGLPDSFAELLGDSSIVFDLELIATEEAEEALDDDDDDDDDEGEEDGEEERVKVRKVGSIRLNNRADVETLLIAFRQNKMGKIIRENEEE